MEITVGQVAGIIAAAVVVVGFLFPNAVVLVLVCLIGNKHSVVTWSVVGRQINNSQWPILLRSDTSATSGVHSKVNGMAYLRPVGTALIAIAAIITPLGLYDALLPAEAMQQVPFSYLQDSSPLGYGTPEQGSHIWFSRSCGGMLGQAYLSPRNRISSTTDQSIVRVLVVAMSSEMLPTNLALSLTKNLSETPTISQSHKRRRTYIRVVNRSSANLYQASSISGRDNIRSKPKLTRIMANLGPSTTSACSSPEYWKNRLSQFEVWLSIWFTEALAFATTLFQADSLRAQTGQRICYGLNQ